MNNLLAFTIEAHGGFENWSRFDKISTRILFSGSTWEHKQQSGILQDMQVIVNTRKQHTLLLPHYDKKIQVSIDPDRTAIESRTSQTFEELPKPRSSFEGHQRTSAWSFLQAYYFAGYSMWNYFNQPFNFADPAYQTIELEPWEENGEVWRRLMVIFPAAIATHSTVQTFYIDTSGLLRRHDYNIEISGHLPAVHYLFDYTDFQGIKIPTKRKIYLKNENNNCAYPESVLFDMQLDQIELF